jgi:hypothetical protein
MTKLRVCQLGNNSLSGPLPDSWSVMAALLELELDTNALTGPVPPSWGSWGSVRKVALFANPQLSGCLPAAWSGRWINQGRTIEVEGPYKGGNLLTAGTGITGFC